LLESFISPELKIMPMVAEFSKTWSRFDPRPAKWDVWWGNWYWDRFFCDCFGYPLSVSNHQSSHLIHSFICY